jgi:hypothetical protein
MKTIQLPPLCPFGDSGDDAVVLHRPSSKAVIWQVARNHFMRVNIYEDGDVTYFLGTRKEVQDDLLDSILDVEGGTEIDEGGRDWLREFRFTRLLKRLELHP